MNEFKRSIERNHKTQITHKQFEQETRSQSDFNLTWIPFHYKSFVMIAIIFAFSQFLCNPFLTQYCGQAAALVISHGVISSVLVAVVFWAIEAKTRITKVIVCKILFLCFDFWWFFTCYSYDFETVGGFI